MLLLCLIILTALLIIYLAVFAQIRIIEGQTRIIEGFGKKKELKFAKCSKLGLNKTLEEVFSENKISRDNDQWDIFLPCGYNNVESEIFTENSIC